MINKYVFDNQLVHAEHEYVLMFKGYPEDVKPNLNLLALPPPKRFLKAGSILWSSPNVKYTFDENSRKIESGTKISVKKYHNIDDIKLRLLKIGYFFRRDKDVMAESKGKFLSVVYNVETKALYLIKAHPTWKTLKGGKRKGGLANKHNWSKKVIRLSLNSLQLQLFLASFDGTHVDKFIKDLKKLVEIAVPDVCDICDNRVNRITALILQHRLGKSIPNLNDNFMSNLAAITSYRFLESRANELEKDNNNDRNQFTTREDIEKKVLKLRTKSTYKFIPTLQKTGSIKKALRVALGECYIGIYPKLLFDINWDMVSMGSETSLIRYKKEVPKAIQHFVAQVFKHMPLGDFKILFKEVLELTRPPVVREHIKDSWVRTIKRLKTTVPWRTWVDTYRMGDELGVRIRPNSFNNMQNIHDLHDGFSNIIRRNRNIINEALNVGPDVKFVKINYPLTFEGYTFRQLLSPKDLVEETDTMKHCVHTYDRNCLKGDSIIFSATNPEGKRWTVEYSGYGDYSFVQAEGNQCDNGGQRYFCPNELAQEIFRPFSLALSRLDMFNTPYKMLCTLNLTIAKIKRTAFALDAMLDLDMVMQSMKEEAVGIEVDVHNHNCILEDLIWLNKRIVDKTLKTNASNLINELLAKVSNLKTAGKVIMEPQGRRIQPAPRPVPRRAVPIADLFPRIGEEVIREVQQEIDPICGF